MGIQQDALLVVPCLLRRLCTKMVKKITPGHISKTQPKVNILSHIFGVCVRGLLCHNIVKI